MNLSISPKISTSEFFKIGPQYALLIPFSLNWKTILAY